MIRNLRVYGGRTYFSVAIGVLALFLIGVLLVMRHQQSQHQFAENFLQTLWVNYKDQHYNSGRAIDNQNNNVTTSEGQSYTMLRAVWENDPSTFAETWNWTATHLERSDHLYSWVWGNRTDGTTGILTNQGGENTASDADTQIAIALLMANAKWHNQSYLHAAQATIQAIWNEEVVMVHGVPYLAADNLEKSGAGPAFTVNPSYIAPYAYRDFATVDRSDNWSELVGSSYTFLNDVIRAPLDTGKSAGLPTDWVVVNRNSGALQASTNPGQSTDFGYNAFRTVWQVSLDWQWNHDAQSKEFLSQLGFLNQEWNQNHKLSAIYTHAGQSNADYASLALYGGTLGYFDLFDNQAAQSIVSSQFIPLYNEKLQQITRPLSYYDNNWVWFGYAQYSGRLQNLISVSR
jgi:endoglucanase